jgi:spore coat polysaccharide biosynthesis protein SpsF
MTSLRVAAIVQARLTSSRLPGKILHTYGGVSVIERVAEAAKRSSQVFCVAIPDNRSNKYLYDLLTSKGVPVVTGDERNVFNRFKSALEFVESEGEVDVVLRLTADNYLINVDGIRKLKDYWMPGVSYVGPIELSPFLGELINPNYIRETPLEVLSDEAIEHVTYDLRRTSSEKVILLDNHFTVNDRISGKYSLDDLDDLIVMKSLENAGVDSSLEYDMLLRKIKDFEDR